MYIKSVLYGINLYKALICFHNALKTNIIFILYINYCTCDLLSSRVIKLVAVGWIRLNI